VKKLTRDNLWSLEDYAVKRADYRAKVIAHKKNRQVPLGEYARLHFEDEITIRYQNQDRRRPSSPFRT
jgi:hypothetical protein